MEELTIIIVLSVMLLIAIGAFCMVFYRLGKEREKLTCARNSAYKYVNQIEQLGLTKFIEFVGKKGFVSETPITLNASFVNKNFRIVLNNGITEIFTRDPESKLYLTDALEMYDVIQDTLHLSRYELESMFGKELAKLENNIVETPFTNKPTKAKHLIVMDSNSFPNFGLRYSNVDNKPILYVKILTDEAVKLDFLKKVANMPSDVNKQVLINIKGLLKDRYGIFGKRLMDSELTKLYNILGTNIYVLKYRRNKIDELLTEVFYID